MVPVKKKKKKKKKNQKGFSIIYSLIYNVYYFQILCKSTILGMSLYW